MQIFILAFLASLIATLLIIRYQHLHAHFTADHDLNGVQKFHSTVVPRVGGVGVVCAMLACLLWLGYKAPNEFKPFGLLLIAASPAFIGGLVEDCTKRVGVLARLGLTMLAAALGFWLLKAGINRLDIPLVDSAMRFWIIALIFTMVAVGGVVNAVNIIDGYNGLASMVSIMMLAALGYVGFQLGDPLIWKSALAMMGGILGFFVWNYPRGLIFLGDGGAYLIGFMIAELSVLLVARHPQVSPWFPLLVVMYPVFETLFSIYRRAILRGTSAGMPDAAHMHQLIYKRLVRWAVGSKHAGEKTTRNAMTSPYLWLLCSFAVLPAVLFWDNRLMLQIFVLVFVILYVVLYRRLVRFNAPRWLLVRKPADKK
ncbi:glycosyltransferase [Jeongeupia sp. HS-3]|uniref:MraY family glycosyltransferase n=1 Tax=Jeongeupia sp. HS-3 TaxID=1009682 RepID=UPI001910BE53|nr:glycosyltransferase [Jeongeupia sp. HS-3]